MNAEWTLAAEPIDLTSDDTAPHMPADPRPAQRPRPKWLTGLGLLAAACASEGGIFLLYATLIGWHWLYAVLPTLLFSAITVAVYLMIAAIAWRSGRLVR